MIPNVVGRVLIAVAILLAPAYARAQNCVRTRPQDICEHGVSHVSGSGVYDAKLTVSPARQKIGAAVWQAAVGVEATLLAEDATALPSVSTEGVKVNDAGDIHVYVMLDEFRPEHVAQLVALGVHVELTLPEFRLVQGWVPTNVLDVVASLDFVTEVKPPGYRVLNAGAQLTAGDSILRADSARASLGVTGAGVTVGVMSDGVDHLTNSVATGDLPPNVQVLKSTGGDEGTAMLEIVHDIAPGATLAFYGPTTSADMVSGITALRAAGARVIVDDIVFGDEPKFQDGMIAQAARTFATQGGVYVTAGGNYGQRHYRAVYNRLTGRNFPDSSYPAAHNYASSTSPDIGNTFTLPNNCRVQVILQWNNPNGASADDFDVFLARSSDLTILASSTNAQTGTQNALESLTYRNTSGAAMTVFIAIAEFRLVTTASSLVLDYFVRESCGIGASSGFQYTTAADSVIGHAAVNEVLSVAALPASAPTQAEPFSSRGPASISFPTAESRSVPNIGGIDCVATRVGAAGFFDNPFCGSSAAAPHVAGVAALVIERNPGLTSQQLRSVLEGTAVDLGAPGFDTTFGFGRVDALAAVMAALPSFTLTVSKTGTGSGTVITTPAGINCGTTCTASFASGTSVTLTAAANPGSTFDGWSGGGCTGTNPCSVTVNAATTVTAAFTLRPSTPPPPPPPSPPGQTFQLTVTKAGTGTGTVMSTPDGITCGAACTKASPAGTTVMLTAIPIAGEFAGWTGGGCRGTGPCSVVVSADTTVTAVFAANKRESFVAGFYEEALGRAPEASGLANVVAFLSANCNAQGFNAIAQAFFDSQEFRTARPLTLTALVTELYRTFLRREPDPAGVAAFVDVFRQARVGVALQGFIPSAEFRQLLPNRQDRAAVIAVVSRFYTQILGRAPDAAGLASHTDFVLTTGNLEAIALGFLTSPEFESRALTARDYVTILYRTFLGREPDLQGLDGWEAVLRTTLLQVINAGFVPSREFQQLVPQVCQ